MRIYSMATLPAWRMQSGPALFLQRDFAFPQRFAATRTEIFIEVLVGQDQQ